MTTKADNTANKTSAAMHNAKLVLKDNAKVMILITALHLMAVPLVLITAAMHVSSGQGQGVNEGFAVLGVITTAVAGLLGISIAINNFSYLFKKTDVDMIYSLPISKKHKFLSDYITGLIAYVVPFIAVQILSSIIIVILHFAYDGKTFNYPSTDEFGNHLTYVCEMFGLAMPYYFKLVLIGIIVMVMLYTVTVLVLTCCGSAFECIFYNILLNAAIPVTIVIFAELLFRDLYGVVASYKFQWLLFATSPAGGAIGAFIKIMYGTNSSNIIPLAISLLTFTIIYFTSAYFLYMKRKAEDVGKPFVFKIVYYIAMTLTVFCIGMLYMNSDMSVVIAIIITAVLYLIMEMVTNRGLKKVWMSAIRYGLTIGLVYGFVFIFNTTEGLGSIQRMPSANNISKVMVHYSDTEGLQTDIHYYSDYTILNSTTNKMENDTRYVPLTSKDSIEKVLKLHKNVIDEYKQYHEYDGFDAFYAGMTISVDNGEKVLIRDVEDIEIIYYLKNGQKIIRQYPNLSIENVKLLEEISFSDDYKAQMEKVLPSKTSLDMSFYLKAKSDFEGNFMVFNKWYGTIWNQIDFKYREFDLKFYEGFVNEYIKDYKDDTYEKRYAGFDGCLYIILNGYNYVIPEYYTNTREFLKQYNVKTITNEKMLEYNANPQNLKIAEISSPEDIYKNSHMDYLISSLTPWKYVYCRNTYQDDNKIYEVTEDLLTLMEVARIGYITDEKCYTIVVGGTVGVIPPEYNDVAKRVYDQAGYEKYAEKMGIATDE